MAERVGSPQGASEEEGEDEEKIIFKLFVVSFNQPYQVIGFHSCDREVGLRIVSGRDHLMPSNNKWDWLGPGIYFWEDNPFRALDYAVDCAKKKQKFNGEIKTPFVIGAIIELGNCLNLVEPNATHIIKLAHKLVKDEYGSAGKKMPVNNGANRSLDCAVIRQVHLTNSKYGITPYDTIRCPFHEGEAIYEQANFTSGLHIEICVVDPAMIKGYFLPQPLENFNPWLHEDFHR